MGESSGPSLSRFDAVLFDLLTGLLDSWDLWNRVAGSPELGLRWRLRYLDLSYGAGAYRSFEALIEEAARDLSREAGGPGSDGLDPGASEELLAAWGELQPWSEVREVLPALPVEKVGAVTNCSEALARIAADQVGFSLDPVVSAERAGAYKPDPRPYQLALDELGVAPKRVLFVAGSPSDIAGAAGVGMPVVWHNRGGLPVPSGPGPMAIISDLSALSYKIFAPP